MVNSSLPISSIEQLRKHCQTFAKQPFLSCQDRVFTYAQFWKITEQLADKHRKLPAGSCIAIHATTDIALPFWLFAFWLKGCIILLLNPQFPKLLQQQIVEQMNCSQFLRKTAQEHDFPFTCFRNEVLPKTLQEQKTSFPPEAFSLILTSGSSGIPKAVLHSFANHLTNALGSNENILLSSGDIWLASLPMYHVGGISLLFRTMLAGSSLFFPSAKYQIAQLLTNQPITHISLVPPQLFRLLQDSISNSVCKNLKTVLVGGAAIPHKWLEQAHTLHIPIKSTYGCTEMASQVTTSVVHSLKDWKSSGQVLPFREVQISQQQQIQVRGQTRFLGYWKNGCLEMPFDAEGWFATGDLGYLDEQQNLHFTGRIDNQFVSGGENIHCEEIEQILKSFPGVEQAIVVPVPHEYFGERPFAFVHSGQEWEEEKLRSLLAEHFAEI